MNRLNIIGCGSVGSTLGRLWHDTGSVRIGDILNQSKQSAEHAVTFIGEGRAIGLIDEMVPANAYLIGTPDDRIAEADKQLAGSGVLQPGDIVFHCSGALLASHLVHSAAAGAEIASVHPINSFAVRETAVEDFPGTFCGIEGSPEAVEILGGLFKAIGGELLPIDSSAKTIYHGAGVIVCNYLTALMEIGLQAYEKAGLERDTALRVMAPIVTGTIHNVFADGTAAALTGPIARGDVETVSRQVTEISAWNPTVGKIYKLLGQIAVDLSRSKGAASSESLEVINNLLKNINTGDA